MPPNGYHIEIAMVMDVTGSMGDLLERVRSTALDLPLVLRSRMKARSRNIDHLAVRPIAFKDFHFDDQALVSTPCFLRLPDQRPELEQFLASLHASGGGDEPESALEGLATAICGDWGASRSLRRRQIVVVWTDAPAHALEHGCPGQGRTDYPDYLPRTLDELSDAWCRMSLTSRRLLLYAPACYPWTTIGSAWPQTIHFPSKAGEGLKEFEFDTIVNALVNSI